LQHTQQHWQVTSSDNAVCTPCSITVIAQTLSKLPALEYLDLGYNGLLGPLDTACGLAATKELESLDFTNNALSGSIPPCLTGMSACSLHHLQVKRDKILLAET
jgi:hypothetical protein